MAAFCLAPPASAGVYEELRSAVEANHTGDIAKLLARGDDPNTPDEQGNTLLMIAVRNNNPQLVDILMNAGAKLNLRNRYGETAIMLASYKGLYNIVEKLYIKGAEVKHDGWNPLLYAATNGHANVIQLLLDGGVPINSTSPNGTTPLMMAARGNHLDAVNVLLKNGADPNLKNDAGKTAVTFALGRNHSEIAEVLRSRGAKE
jgi:ankyrin repeat protein